jgi:hypothetical protein
MKRDLDYSRVSSIDGFDAGEKNQRDSDVVYVLASSVVARRRWRLLREHWMSSYACVGLHQIARQMSLQHCDDYDDGVTVLLHVNVLEARGLAAADVDGRADPYCVVTAAPGARLRTKCQRKTLDPVWGQAFSFTAPPGIRRSGNKITLTVVDHDDFDFDDEMGVACVPFHDVPYVAPGMIPPGPVWLPLESRESNLLERGRHPAGRSASPRPSSASRRWEGGSRTPGARRCWTAPKNWNG